MGGQLSRVCGNQIVPGCSVLLFLAVALRINLYKKCLGGSSLDKL